MISKLFTKEQIEFIVANYKGIPFKELTNMLNLKFKTNFNTSQVQNYCSRNKMFNGLVGGRFAKGFKPFNKGLKWDEYMSKEAQNNSKKTTFKRGNLNGRAKQLHKPVGSERIDKDGYIMIKVREPNVWRLKHRVIWEEVHGKIPPKHCLMFLDGNKKNIQLENLILVKRSDLARFNQLGLLQSTPEITYAGITIARIQTKMGERRKKNGRKKNVCKNNY